jgi:hypothetical protein
MGGIHEIVGELGVVVKVETWEELKELYRIVLGEAVSD